MACCDSVASEEESTSGRRQQRQRRRRRSRLQQQRSRKESDDEVGHCEAAAVAAAAAPPPPQSIDAAHAERVTASFSFTSLDHAAAVLEERRGLQGDGGDGGNATARKEADFYSVEIRRESQQRRRRCYVRSPTLSDEELNRILQSFRLPEEEEQVQASPRPAYTVEGDKILPQQLSQGEAGFSSAHPTSQQLEHLNSSRVRGGGESGEKGSSPLIPKSDQQHQSLKAAASAAAVQAAAAAATTTRSTNAQSKQLESEQESNQQPLMTSSLSGTDQMMEFSLYQPHHQQPANGESQAAVAPSLCFAANDATTGGNNSSSFISHQEQHQFTMTNCTQQQGFALNTMMQPQLVQYTMPQQQPQQQQVVFHMSSSAPTDLLPSASPSSFMLASTNSGVSPGQSSVDSGYMGGGQAGNVLYSLDLNHVSSVVAPVSAASPPVDSPDVGYAGSPADSEGQTTNAASRVEDNGENEEENEDLCVFMDEFFSDMPDFANTRIDGGNGGVRDEEGLEVHG